ncbi:zinc finger protein 271-like [Phlebotomus papatasi]|uniref:zinc finger protein 271-like n=1 Tax=Phlebotomus papatasi TaxID=29031 RepID=UPI0024835F8C|nr:zinc finger protein 271-like [Phlebotomus papatasi]
MKFLSDAQKTIVLKYFHLNPELVGKNDPSGKFFSEMVRELNDNCQEVHDSVFWFDSIDFWRENARENYLYAKKNRSIVSSYEDLELLILMKGVMLESQARKTVERDEVLEERINCRICLNVVDSGASLNLFTSFVDNLSLGQLLNSCTDIIPVVEHDGLPEMICFNCSKLLRSAYNFKILCESSDQQIRNALLSSTKNPAIESELETNVPDFFEDDTVSVYHVDYPYEGDFHEFEDSLCSNERNRTDFTGNSTEMDIASEEMISVKEEPPEIVQETVVIKRARTKKPPDPEAAEKPANSQEKNSKQCDFCGLVFRTNGGLRIHKKIHLGERPHTCTYCEKSFRTRLALKIHIRSHTGERPYVCETCGKGFKTISSINNHRAIHLEERQFHCPLCPYRASTKANLKIHHRTHTGVKPYTCQLCGATFMTASNMQKHVRNIHKKLKTHKCDECGRSFFTKESAMKHAVTHSGAKPYKCPVCMLAYGWYNGLQKHMRIQHRGVKVPKEKTFLEAMELKAQVKRNETMAGVS